MPVSQVARNIPHRSVRPRGFQRLAWHSQANASTPQTTLRHGAHRSCPSDDRRETRRPTASTHIVPRASDKEGARGWGNHRTNSQRAPDSMHDPLPSTLQRKSAMHLHRLTGTDTGSGANRNPRIRLRLPMMRRAVAGRACTATPGGAGALGRSGRWVAAGPLLAFVALLALLPEAQAQTTIKMVGNGAGSGSTTHLGTNASGDYREVAQRFTSGANSGGYTLSTAAIWFSGLPANADVTNFVAAIYTNTSDTPGTLKYTLTNPSSDFATDGRQDFSAPADSTLDPGTKYWLVLKNDNATGELARLAPPSTSSNASPERSCGPCPSPSAASTTAADLSPNAAPRICLRSGASRRWCARARSQRRGSPRADGPRHTRAHLAPPRRRRLAPHNLRPLHQSRLIHVAEAMPDTERHFVGIDRIEGAETASK